VAYRNRGQAYAAKGDTDRARADIDAAVRLDPSLAKK
jgi:Tfp pilus assembly protein PilF